MVDDTGAQNTPGTPDTAGSSRPGGAVAPARTRPGRRVVAAGRRFAGTAAGVWVAALLVVGFRLDGPADRQLAAVALVAAFTGAAVLIVPWPVGHLLGRALRRNQRRMAQEPDFAASDWEFFAPMRRHMVLVALHMLVGLVTFAVVSPVALWAAVRVCRAAGLSAELTGLWPVVVSGVLVIAVATVTRLLFALLRKRSRGAAVRGLFAVALNAGGLALAVALLDGVRLDGPGRWQALTLTALSCLFQLRLRLTLTLPVPGVASLLLVAANAVALWLICQATTLMELRLHIDGLWPLMGTAALMWVMEWPARLADRHAENAHRPPPVPYDPFPPDHMFPTGPLY
ncbi:hypothetical protein [Streptomyces sp. NPDC006368]|uniref:hypothetical protein n=1 Tax=Streptomyces sp. NPDC006368 TaxID=3156760 RepID=UPI0033AA6100